MDDIDVKAKDAAAGDAQKLVMDAWQAYADGLITWSQWRHLVGLLSKKR